MNGKIIDWLKDIFQICCNGINIILKRLDKHFGFIMRIIFFVFSLLAILYRDISMIKWIIAIIILFIITELFSYVHKELKEKEEMKYTPKERFTKKTISGDISVNENKLHQAIIYLSLLEDKIWGDI